MIESSDPEISFDENGVCNHCHGYDRALAKKAFEGALGHQKLGQVIAQIKREGAGKRYDCVLGLSGGVILAYVAFLCKKFDLRPLAVHLDNGWNREIAVHNINNIS